MRKYWMMALAVMLGALLGGALFAMPASATTAQDDTELPSASGASEYLAVTVAVIGNCAATITYTNSVPDEFSGSWAYWGDYRVGEQAGQPDSAFPDLPLDSDGELVVEDYQDGHNHGVDPDTLITSGPLAGEAFGLQYNPVLIHRGDTRIVDVAVNAPTTLTAWIKRGPEQPWYVGEVVVEVPCEQADDDADTDTDTDDSSDTNDDAGSADDIDDKTSESTSDDKASESTSDEQLPVTGSKSVVLGGAAALLGLTGGGLMLLARRKRPTFTAGDE